MRLLLDTHTLLWVAEGNARLSDRAIEALADPANEKLVSAVSAYEICMKHALGKLPGAAALALAFEREIAALDCTPLSVTLAHAETAGRLDLAHRDPFDRLLIAQAQVEDLTLVSNEQLFDGYGIRRLW